MQIMVPEGLFFLGVLEEQERTYHDVRIKPERFITLTSKCYGQSLRAACVLTFEAKGRAESWPQFEWISAAARGLQLVSLRPLDKLQAKTHDDRFNLHYLYI
jgi:hypothetical protein